MSFVFTLAAVRAVLVQGGSPELEMELRTNELAVCSAPCDARAIVKCVDERECVVEVSGVQRTFEVHTREGRVRMAEAVRAALLELIPSDAPKPANAPRGGLPTPAATRSPKINSSAVTPSAHPAPKPQAPIRRFEPRSPRAWELALGPSLVWQGGTVGADLGARAVWFPARKFGIALEGSVPLAAGHYSGSSSQASLQSWMMASALTVKFIDDVLRLRAALGVALARVETRATRYDANWIAMPYVRGETGVNLGAHWFIPLLVTLGVGVPSTSLELRDGPVSRWATPLVRVESGLGYAW